VLKPVSAVAAIGDPITDSRCWPVDLRCEDDSGNDYTVRVKPVTSNKLRAVAISEAIAWGVLGTLDLPAAEPFVVSITPQFASDLTAQCGYDPPVVAGRQWGTGVLPGIGLDQSLTRDDLDQVGNPDHLFRIFLLDEVMANSDRTTDGNTLLVADPTLPARLIAIDQSECFHGPECLLVNECLARTINERYAHHYSAMESVLLTKPPTFIDDEIRLVQSRRSHIAACVNLPHEEWYELAQIDPGTVSQYLSHRIDSLATLAQRDYWVGICKIGQLGGLGA
jgi:hypothetical protein